MYPGNTSGEAIAAEVDGVIVLALHLEVRVKEHDSGRYYYARRVESGTQSCIFHWDNAKTKLDLDSL